MQLLHIYKVRISNYSRINYWIAEWLFLLDALIGIVTLGFFTGDYGISWLFYRSPYLRNKDKGGSNATS